MRTVAKRLKRCLFAAACAMAPQAHGMTDNLLLIAREHSHPICGIDPSFAAQPTHARRPFAVCRTLAPGLAARRDFTSPGQTALTKLFITIATAADWQRMFDPLNPPMQCRISAPPALPPPTQQVVATLCTVDNLQHYLAKYDNQASVRGFRKFERAVRLLDLGSPAHLLKIKQAEAMIWASGGAATFDDIAEVLK